MPHRNHCLRHSAPVLCHDQLAGKGRVFRNLGLRGFWQRQHRSVNREVIFHLTARTIRSKNATKVFPLHRRRRQPMERRALLSAGSAGPYPALVQGATSREQEFHEGLAKLSVEQSVVELDTDPLTRADREGRFSEPAIKSVADHEWPLKGDTCRIVRMFVDGGDAKGGFHGSHGLGDHSILEEGGAKLGSLVPIDGGHSR